MLEYSRWKYLTILIVVLISAFYALPNVFPQDPSVQISANRGAKVDDALKQQVTQALTKAGLKSKTIEVQGENLLVRTADDDTQNKVADALRDTLGNRYTVAMNRASTVPAWFAKVGAKPMALGLDLQGGVHFLMEVDKKAAVDKRFEAYLSDIRGTLREEGIPYESVERDGDKALEIILAKTSDLAEAQTLVQKGLAAAAADTGAATAGRAFSFESSGNTIRVAVSDEMIRQMTLNAIEQNLGTLRNRINSLGVAEPVIQRQGADRVLVQLPGVQDTAAAKRILGATATLEYRGVYEGNPIDARETGNVPPGARLYESRRLGPDGKPVPVLLNKRIIVSGADMVDARSTVDNDGLPAVSVTLNTAGGQRMLQFTTENVGKPMAVVFIERIPQVRIVDGKEVRTSLLREEVISVATIQGVFSKQFQTTGLERKEADELSKLLKAGALAAPMDFVEERTVGPSLGKENVERGLKAVAFSFLFALAFFLIYYRMFGVVTCVALLLNLLMVFALMSLFGATMSLPGLAGIALTVGMSVDANVLINERIREELRAGLPPQAAIAAGYDRASGTILDANITAFLAGLAMFAFGTGPLKGFGVTTMLGIATSAYTAVSVSRGIATLIYGRRRKLQSIAI
ncbi:protein translocase subunit SecD [Lysobacter hankyongensis]|uniref:Protein translocase subunit SecD n=1 Tax=Lysobacter hankyongensis TaxID=1176535 RepID=A0ABP9AI40_9GAMM